MKYKTSLLSLAVAAIVLGSLMAVAGVAAAKTTVGTAAPIQGTPGIAFVYGGGGARLLVATNTTDGTLYYTLASGTGTLTWTQIAVSGSAVKGANPAVVKIDPVHVDVFAVSSSGMLMSLLGSYQGGGVWTWTDLTSTLPGTNAVLSGTGPAGVCRGPVNAPWEVDVAYVNTANHLVVNQLPSSGPNTQAEIASGYVLGTPAITETNYTGNNGTSIVIVAGRDGIYENDYMLGSWNTWTKLNDGSIGAGASLITGAPLAGWTNDTWLFVAGKNARLYALVSNNGGFTWNSTSPPTLNWQPLTGALTSSVATSAYNSYAANTIFAAVRGADGFIYVNTVTITQMPAGGTVTGSWSASITM
jgi:hypothetical protein